MPAARLNEDNALEAEGSDPAPLADGVPEEHEPTLPPHVTAHLGDQLQAFYAQLLSEPVPERFTRLLEQLDQQEKTVRGG